MGKGQAKGRKGRKGKPLAMGKGRAHTAEAWRHAQEVNERRLAAGKGARSTASISRSQLRAQQHHAAKAKAKQLAESRSNRSRSPPRRRPSCSPTSEADPVYSYVEESEEESVGRGGAGSGDPLVDPRQPPASVKAPVSACVALSACVLPVIHWPWSWLSLHFPSVSPCGPGRGCLHLSPRAGRAPSVRPLPVIPWTWSWLSWWLLCVRILLAFELRPSDFLASEFRPCCTARRLHFAVRFRRACQGLFCFCQPRQKGSLSGFCCGFCP